jgi:hypothetical protein
MVLTTCACVLQFGRLPFVTASMGSRLLVLLFALPFHGAWAFLTPPGAKVTGRSGGAIMPHGSPLLVPLPLSPRLRPHESPLPSPTAAWILQNNRGPEEKGEERRKEKNKDAAPRPDNVFDVQPAKQETSGQPGQNQPMMVPNNPNFLLILFSLFFSGVMTALAFGIGALTAIDPVKDFSADPASLALGK